VAWQLVNTARHDAEGCEDVCLATQASPLWRCWVRQLSPSQLSALQVWRAGAVHTPTRCTRNSTLWGCPHCAEQVCSARHLFSACPRCAALRECPSRKWNMPTTWWHQQPQERMGGAAERYIQLKAPAADRGMQLRHRDCGGNLGEVEAEGCQRGRTGCCALGSGGGRS